MTHSNDSSPVWGLRTVGPHEGLRAPHEQLSLVLAQAKKHASVQRLAAQYEEWETSLRREAEERIGGFKPLQRFIEASGQTEDWQLLRRVKSRQPGFSPSMKRSASEGTLTMSEYQPRTHQRVHMRQEWDPLGSVGSGTMHTPHEAQRERGNSADGQPPAAASDSGAPAPSSPPAHHTPYHQRFPRATTAPSLQDAERAQQDEEDEEDELQQQDELAAAERRRASAPGAPHSSPSADELAARQLEAVAARLLQQSRVAIQSAQAAVQETAINCSQNLQTLGALFSASVAQGMSSASGSSDSLANGDADQPAGAARSSSGGLGGGSGGSQLQLVPWLAADRAASTAGQAVEGPWELIPRYLRLTAEGLGAPLALGDGSDGATAAAVAPTAAGAGVGAAGGPPAVYRQLAQYFDRLEEERRRRRRARAGGAYSSLKEPGRNVAIVTTASLPWMTGTAVNPLLRAAYLANEGAEAEGKLGEVGEDGKAAGGACGGAGRRRVTLLLPWLNKSDQERVFPGAVTFDSPSDQEAFVREWAQKRTGLPCNFVVKFYPGRYAPEKGERVVWNAGGWV